MIFNNRLFKILSHILFWVIILFVSFSGESLQYGPDIPWRMLSQFAGVFLIIASVSYLNTLILIPRFFKRKRYILYFTFLVLAILAGGALALVLRNTFLSLGLEAPSDWKFGEGDHVNYFLHIVLGESLLVLLTTFFYVTEELIKLQDVTIRLKDAEKEKIQAQLQELKAQVNPHFLFNTLNNIYSHSLVQSPKTPEMILKMSDLMSYILYECNEDKVPVINELAFIRNYVDLEKLRYEDQIDIRFSVEELSKGKKIAPLIFIPFVENAFKHGGNRGSENKFVEIEIRVESEKISLNVRNSISERMDNREKGIGLENVKKRLDLLYNQAYSLGFNNNPDIFSVQLEIFEYGD